MLKYKNISFKAQKTQDKITMKDDSALFELTISTGDLLITPYATKLVQFVIFSILTKSFFVINNV